MKCLKYKSAGRLVRISLLRLFANNDYDFFLCRGIRMMPQSVEYIQLWNRIDRNKPDMTVEVGAIIAVGTQFSHEKL